MVTEFMLSRKRSSYKYEITEDKHSQSPFVMKNVSDRTQKRIILKQINLICRGSKYFAEKVEYVKSRYSLTCLTRRTESRKRVASNLQNKKEAILGSYSEHKSYINKDD